MKRNLSSFLGFEIDENKFERPQPVMIEQENQEKVETHILSLEFQKNTKQSVVKSHLEI